MASLTLITKVINDQLNDYNENHLVMNLILFKEHVIRISRDITSHNDHMLLGCVGGPGKQSLVRLSATLVGFGVFQITLANYGVMEFNADLVKVFLQAGKKQPTVFLLTGSQGIDERMLIPISDFLSAGVLPGIFGQEGRELVYSTVEGDVKVQGI